MSKPRYSDIARQIDIDALEDALGFEVLEQSGDWDQGYCLFAQNHAHGDTTGKLGINREHRKYHCWVCGSGDLLSLAMETQGLDVDDATYWLTKFTHDTRSDAEFLREFELDLEDTEARVESMRYFNERVLDKWIATERPYTGSPILDDQDRTIVLSGERASCVFRTMWGIYYQVASDHKLGYDPEHTRLNARLAGERYVGPALIFPHFWQGQLVGWQERWLEEIRPKWIPKYTNTTDFPRSTTVFNYDNALRRSQEKTFIVESIPTALMLVSRGFNAVATFGSNVNPAQLRLLRRLNGGVIIGPDNDKPSKPGGKPTGLKWRDGLAEYLQRFIEVELLPPPPGPSGTDLADLSLRSQDELITFLETETKDPLEVI